MMPPPLAAALFVGLIIWLLARDRARRTGVSGALWLPVLWLLVIGSRPVSQWSEGGLEMETPEQYLKGSPFDMAIFLSLIVGGVLVLVQRRIHWQKLASNNTWLFLFFLYWLASVVWSDFPFVGFKRWIKDVGNLVMVLVVFTEADPVQAARAAFLRCAYVLIPLSVLFIKYYPHYGRYYNPWTWTPVYCGVTTEKNALGCLVLVCGLFLIWEMFGMRFRGSGRAERAEIFSKGLLLAMCFWLLSKADSSTALVCLFLGAGIVFVLRFPFALRHIRHLGAYTLTVAVVLLFVYAVPGVLSTILDILGEDLTLTGRTDLWKDLLSEPINPLLGTGYQTFWLGERAELLWEKYYFHPNQAHNGYIETYLNGGFLGVASLLALLGSAGGRIKTELLARMDFAKVRFASLVIGVFYNWTEAVFNRLNLVWFIILLASVNYPRAPRAKTAAASAGARNKFDDAREARTSPASSFRAGAG
jgi:O-antigen ligase